MSLFVDLTYIGMMGSRLPLFRQVKHNLFNFRCNVCGDSVKNQFKRRAYFYVTKSGDSYGFQCHNCNASHSLYTFIQLKFPEMLNAYRLEKFTNKSSNHVLEEAIPFKKLEVVFDDVIPLDFLPKDHSAVRYLLEDRKLPEELLEKFLFVEKYVEWLKKTTHDDLHYKEHSRILIPFEDDKGNIYRYIARSYDCDISAKYLYTDIDQGSPFYNWYHVDPSKKVYVVEGAIDSMLLPNSIAIGNAKYARGDFTNFADYVIIPDNESRSPQIVKSVEKAVLAGLNVCIWPRYLGKDINDMYKNGVSIDTIQNMIDENTY
ncbi:MAG TPA: hypothetical protein VFM18_10190, partial [Methanosarcina sp.]|nr:hypothetical protein [Methanosarcina sp.]